MSSRGTGRLLATTVPMYEVRMDFAAQGLADSVFRKYADSLAGALATFFGDKSKNAYLILLNRAYSNKSKNRFTQIAPRRVNHLEIKQISQFPILRLGQNRGGFIPVQINKRLLPNGRWPRARSAASTRRDENGASRERSTACCAGPTAIC